jgi:hypothetical protein
MISDNKMDSSLIYWILDIIKYNITVESEKVKVMKIKKSKQSATHLAGLPK